MRHAIWGALLLLCVAGCGGKKKGKSLEGWMKQPRKPAHVEVAKQKVVLSMPAGLKYDGKGAPDWWDAHTDAGLMFSLLPRSPTGSLDAWIAEEFDGIPAADIKSKAEVEDGGYRAVSVSDGKLRVSRWRPMAGGVLCRGVHSAGGIQNIDEGVAFLAGVCDSLQPE